MPKGIGKFLPSLLGGQKTKSSKEEEEESSLRAELSVSSAEAESSGHGHGRGRGSGSGSGAASGSLNPRKQLEAAYARLFKNEGDGEAWRKEFFQKVRILVLGRSGVGKTTLIRLMVGKAGPQGISEGVAGVQNINKEFLYSSDGVPLIIHDSNGLNVKGKECVDEIKAFLDKHQKGGDFSERIHIVWYVISAVDPRCVDDGDVMKIISEYKIPLLLIMTHSDYDKVKVTDNVLNLLLERAYPEEEDREAVKKVMVKVGNDGVSMDKNNALVIDESNRDSKGLKLVAQRTLQLMDKKLRYTWIAAQAVDTDGKLEESAGIIAGYARSALFTSIPRTIPFTDPLKLTIIFYRLIAVMCHIWVVPPELNKALSETLMQKEASSRVMRSFGLDMVYVAGLAITIGATVATAGAAFPSVIAVLAASGILHCGKAVPVLVKTFALQVLGTILYVKSAQAGSSKQRWKPGVSKEEYVKLCEEFAHNEEYQQLLVNFAKRGHSMLDIAVRKKKVQSIMKAKIVEMYRLLLRNRPNSLFSQMRRDTTTSQHDNNIEIIEDTTKPAPSEFDELLNQVFSNINNGDDTDSTTSEGEEDDDEMDDDSVF
eukprot:c25319_g1_i1 orf=525-2318(-)